MSSRVVVNSRSPTNIPDRYANRSWQNIGIPPAVANALFIISRVPGITAHAEEERVRQPPMRQIDPKDHVYDGPSERRLPERRKRESGKMKPPVVCRGLSTAMLLRC